MAENKMEMDPEVLRTTARKVETSAGDVRKVKAFYICDRRFKQHLEQ